MNGIYQLIDDYPLRFFDLRICMQLLYVACPHTIQALET